MEKKVIFKVIGQYGGEMEVVDKYDFQYTINTNKKVNSSYILVTLEDRDVKEDFRGIITINRCSNIEELKMFTIEGKQALRTLRGEKVKSDIMINVERISKEECLRKLEEYKNYQQIENINQLRHARDKFEQYMKIYNRFPRIEKWTKEERARIRELRRIPKSKRSQEVKEELKMLMNR